MKEYIIVAEWPGRTDGGLRVYSVVAENRDVAIERFQDERPTTSIVAISSVALTAIGDKGRLRYGDSLLSVKEVVPEPEPPPTKLVVNGAIKELR